METVYIRADANEIIATGHVMRCMTIAQQLQKQNIEVVFLVADDRPCAMIRERGFRVDVLNTIWNDLGSETERLCAYIKEHAVKVMIVDSYYVTQEYLQSISHYTRIVYVDDLNRFVYPVHTLINYSAFAQPDWYEDDYRLAGMHTEFLIGSRYIPLREEFVSQGYEVRNNLTRVLLTTGGTDQLNAAGSLLQEFVCNAELSQLEYHVIVGSFNQNQEMLDSLARMHSNVYLHRNVSNMSEWMRFCDAAVSAAGSTLYELCALGIPTVCMEIADNQEGAVQWEKAGYMLYGGNACKERKACIQKCTDALIRYRSDDAERRRKSKRMRSLVDGHGAGRIAEYVRSLL